jgi:hypothetical protein
VVHRDHAGLQAELEFESEIARRAAEDISTAIGEEA